MKNLVLLLLLMCCINAVGQPRSILDAISLTIATKESEEKLREQIIKHTESLRSKTNSKGYEVKFLRKVFYQTHRKFLKEYSPYSSLDQLVMDGKYDCLTATALYASIFEILGFSFKIIETNYHVFILANMEGNDVLIETTDGVNGVIVDTKKVVKRVNYYRDSEPVVNKSNTKGFQFPFQLFNQVSGKQLSGLIYFNQAVKEFNNHNWSTCQYFLSKSKTIYNSPRIDQIQELTNIMITPQKTDDKRLSKLEMTIKPSIPLEE